MKMLRITGIAAFLVLLANWSFGQRLTYEEITEKRIEYIAPRLNLTATEAEKFWPVFREFHKKREEMSRNSKNKNRQFDEKKPVTEEDFLNAINFMIESKHDQTVLMEEFNRRYLQILPPEKLYRFYQLDDEFNKVLLDKLKDSGRGRQQ
jgi:Spy/CpxP family protein refolding chaperone